jgi:small subunit ribosomal protein S14|uniref:Small ribosomal subunit protein uS14c n=1 Tax=Ochromonas sp. CCMP1393 TaxID=420556 RepID=A0A0D3MK48_9STRA|nr:30S ribosomal protein S14 [Ochromonas sp. CCMP1393]
MAKKGMLEREYKRKKLVTKYSEKRKNLLNQLKQANSLEEKFIINEKIQKLPRNSAPTRIRNRCWKTGRPHGYFRFFGLCRNAVRELANDGLLPGVTKASW